MKKLGGTFTLRFEPDLKEKLQKIADSKHVKLGWLVREICLEYVKRGGK